MKEGNQDEIPLRRILGIEFVSTFYGVYDNSQLFFNRYNLTSQQYNVLSILYENDEPLSTAAILHLMVEKNAGVSRLVDRLVLKGYVEKKINQSDKRLIDVFLTEQGRIQCKLVSENLNDVDLVFKNLDDDDVQDMLKLLRKIKGNDLLTKQENNTKIP
ncbi:MarR family winged helix-turn-helix transcriptional regulator [Sphingobacterium sp. LRF_L2]|uniref:MarR family winged helix-turn-helix transcriptional regulator n=1 Tax=Sphingobacterium sp. LRF_L2 TaxID=3369421 RepID=UPI003F60454B